MKLAILSDFHLGNERFADDAFRQALKAMALAVAESDAVLVPGDVFDSRVPRPEAIAQAIEIFRIPLERQWDAKIESFSARDGRKNACRVPVIAIHGTHEVRPKLLVNPIQLLEKGGFLVNAHAARVVIECRNERVAVYGMGGVPEPQAQAALAALDPAPTQGAFNVFTFHQSLRELLPVGEQYLSLEDLPAGFDAYVCGHMHRKLAERFGDKLLVIPGSTVITQLKKEEEAKKGFFLLDTASKQCAFREISARPFFFREVKLDGAGLSEAEALVRKTIAELAASADNPVIRVKVTGSLRGGVPTGAFACNRLAEEFSGRAFVSIEKDFGLTGIAEKVKRLRLAREEGASVRELGLALLRAKLAEKGFAGSDNAAHLFDMLSSTRKDAAEKALDEFLTASGAP